MEQQNKFKFTWFLQPLLIALFPVLHICSYNALEVGLLHIIFAITITTIGTTVFFLLMSLLFNSHVKSAFVTNIAIILFYITRPLMEFVLNPISTQVYFFRVRYVLVILFLGFLFVLYKIYKTNIFPNFFLHALLIPFILLHAFSLKNIILQKITSQQKYLRYEKEQSLFIKNNLHLKQKLKKLAQKTFFPKNLPDIYFIILDAYTSNEALLLEMNFDNQNFTNKLSEKGFFVAKKSKSNYKETFFSIAATLNMQYLPTQEPLHLDWMIEHNNVTYFLKQIGYSYVDLASNYHDVSLSYKEKTVFSKFKKFLLGTNHFTQVFLQNMTPIYPFFENLFNTIRNKSVIQKFALLENIIALQNKPKFVYAHFLAPHFPYTFREDGSVRPPYHKSQNLKQWVRDGYVQAIKFINKKILPIIEKIIKESAVPPIIILQADHGLFKNKFDILNAYYLPNKGEKWLYSTISPVNNFRVVFNHYFEAQLPLLKDETHETRKQI